MNGTPLRVLIVEDCEDDALLLVAELRQGGYWPECQRVVSAAEMVHALDAPWDVVIADYSLPSFDAPAALNILKSQGLDLPFIVVSGALDEEAAVAIMKAGAHDYFRKGNLTLLSAAVRRELGEAAVRAERRLADRRLREQEVRYRTLFEQSPDGVLLIDPVTFRAVEFNDAVCRMLGYSREEFSRLAIGDYEARETKDEIARHVRQLLRVGHGEFETRHRTKTGQLRDVWVTVQTIHLSGTHLLHAIYHDMSARRQAEELVQEGETRYRQLLSAVNNYTYSVHCQNGIVLHTEHGSGCLAVTGYTPQEYLDDPYLWIKMVHPADQGLVRQHVAAVLAGGDPPPLEHRIVRKDGRVCWIRDTIVKHHNEQRELVGYDGLIEDITARRLVEEQLNEQKAQLVVARRIQEHLLPRSSPTLPGFDLAGASYNSDFAAGDYFDYIAMLDGSWAIVVGDVAGHRFASALLMASTRAYIRSLAKMHTGVAEILSLANKILLGDVAADHFVTLFLGRLNPLTHSFGYASAGHETCYLLDRDGAVKVRLMSTGFPLAVAANAEYSSGGPYALEPGDILLLVTDGVHDVQSPAGVPFGTARMLDVVRQHAACPACEIVAKLRDAVFAFLAGRKPDDDVTIVVVKAQG
jgi:PAS domain S-box-containing protein